MTDFSVLNLGINHLAFPELTLLFRKQTQQDGTS
jgi:hypothetical protein